jgi:hypothetical protein
MMTKNLALAASIAMLAVISGLASARAAGPYTRDWPVVTGRSDQQVLRAFNASYSAMAWAAHVPAPAKTSTSPRKMAASIVRDIGRRRRRGRWPG